MTKEEIYKTLNEISNDDTIFWNHIATYSHPTKTNGEVLKKLRELSYMHLDPTLKQLFKNLFEKIDEEVEYPKEIALTEKGVHFFNGVHTGLGV